MNILLKIAIQIQFSFIKYFLFITTYKIIIAYATDYYLKFIFAIKQKVFEFTN